MTKLGHARTSSLSQSERDIIICWIQENQSSMQQWATSAPSNFKNKWLLVEAELCSLTGKQAERAESREFYVPVARSLLALENVFEILLAN